MYKWYAPCRVLFCFFFFIKSFLAAMEKVRSIKNSKNLKFSVWPHLCNVSVDRIRAWLAFTDSHVAFISSGHTTVPSPLIQNRCFQEWILPKMCLLFRKQECSFLPAPPVCSPIPERCCELSHQVLKVFGIYLWKELKTTVCKISSLYVDHGGSEGVLLERNLM